MAITFEDAAELKRQYEDIYRDRHEAFRKLRRYWAGDYWELADTENRNIVSIFRDLAGGKQSDIGPDVKMVHNILQMVCIKFQTFLSPLPMIRKWVDPPESDTSRAQATRMERYMYGCWAMGNMNLISAKQGWYLPLMGDCFLGIHPDFDKKIPVPVLRSPEYAYPIPSFDKQGEQATVFAWKVSEQAAARNFPSFARPIEEFRTRRQGRFRRGQNPDPMVEILEYDDNSEWHRWIAYMTPGTKKEPETVIAQEVNGVEHNFGFPLFQHVKFIEVPDEVWGHGAVEQVVNLTEMGNALYSLMFDAVVQNVYPRMVLIDPAKAPEEIETGPGAIIPVNQGGGVEWLHPPVQALGMQEQFLGMNEHNIKEAAGMSEAEFGRSPASSIVTGKAVNELQGAGSGNIVEMVQGVGIGNALVSWNEKAVTIQRTLFRDDTAHLYGAAYTSATSLVPQHFALKVKGRELIGSPRNDVIFAPTLNPHEKLVMNLQGLGAGLWSKKYVREQHGMPDNDAMVEEIFAETVEDGVLGAWLMQLQGAADPATAEQVEQQAAGYIAGKTSMPGPGGVPHPMAGPLPGGPLPPGPPALPAGAAPGGAPAPAPAAPAGPALNAPAASSNAINVQEAIAAFQGLTGIQGRVWLVGEIVERGTTSDDIEVMVTEPGDRQTIASGLPQYMGRLTFHVTSGEPSERNVEVTPGAQSSTPGLSGPPPPEALAGLGVQ